MWFTDCTCTLVTLIYCTSLSNCTIALCYIAETCTRLEELDACGCLRDSNKTVSAFQESLLYVKETGQRRDFRLLVGGMSLLLPFFFFYSEQGVIKTQYNAWIPIAKASIKEPRKKN